MIYYIHFMYNVMTVIIIINHDWPCATYGVTWTKNYPFFRLKFLIKRMAEMQSRGTEYFGINIECVLYMMCMVGYVRNGDQFEL